MRLSCPKSLRKRASQNPLAEALVLEGDMPQRMFRTALGVRACIVYGHTY
jgi:hypothetical protein